MNTQPMYGAHAVRDLFIGSVAYLGLHRIYRESRRHDGPLTRIVVFHDVSNRDWFAHMVTTIARTYHTLTPDQFFRGERRADAINVLITFDDGYHSWVDVALPVLAHHHLQALFFVCSGLLDVADDPSQSSAFMRDHLHITPRPPLTWDGARTIVASGHTVGGHGRTHQDLTTLSPSALTREIEDDKTSLERTLGVPVTEFAYPFGTRRHVNQLVRRAVDRAGYMRAYTAMSQFVPCGEPFHIPRMCVETGLSPRSLRYWIEGAYDLFDAVKQRVMKT